MPPDKAAVPGLQARCPGCQHVVAQAPGAVAAPLPTSASPAKPPDERAPLADSIPRPPALGAVLKAFVDSYAFLAIGCTLGLAVFKKAPELGLD